MEVSAWLLNPAPIDIDIAYLKTYPPPLFLLVDSLFFAGALLVALLPEDDGALFRLTAGR